MGRKAKCKSCGKEVEKEERVKGSGGFYCKECHEKIQKEKKDYNELVSYSMELLGLDKVDGRVLKQIKDYKDNYKYTYSGIKYTLWYCKEVLNIKFDRKYGIGIVKLKYLEAEKYYLDCVAINDSSKKFEYKPKMIKVNLDKVFNRNKVELINLEELI